MPARTLKFSPEAEEHLSELWLYIARGADTLVADAYLEMILRHCERLLLFPYAGRARDDLRPGLRTSSYQKRTLVAYQVSEETVTVLAILHGGRDLGTVFDDTSR